MGWFKDSHEAQEVRELLANWEYKLALVYLNPLTQAWEVRDTHGQRQRFADKDAAIASARRDGWEAFDIMEDGFAALPEEVGAAYESRAEAVAYTVFFQRRKH